MPFQGRKKYQGVLQVQEGDAASWRIVFADGKTASEQALDFSLEEVREARLVPVVDFKGRRFAPAPVAPASEELKADEEVGGQKE